MVAALNQTNNIDTVNDYINYSHPEIDMDDGDYYASFTNLGSNVTGLSNICIAAKFLYDEVTDGRYIEPYVVIKDDEFSDDHSNIIFINHYNKPGLVFDFIQKNKEILLKHFYGTDNCRSGGLFDGIIK